MSKEDIIRISPILINALVSLVSIFIGYRISRYTINTNRDLNQENQRISAENAGKNRIIYEIERLASPSGMDSIREKLGTGNYTVLNSFSDPGNWGSVIVILGKIRL